MLMYICKRGEKWKNILNVYDWIECKLDKNRKNVNEEWIRRWMKVNMK